jgi:hypothetical protein
MYGFCEKYPNNIFDNIEIPSKYFLQAIKNLKLQNEKLLQRKCDVLLELNLIDESSLLVIGNDGILNEEEILQVLQVNIFIESLCF